MFDHFTLGASLIRAKKEQDKTEWARTLRYLRITEREAAEIMAEHRRGLLAQIEDDLREKGLWNLRE